MEFLPGFTEVFMSPVSGRINLTALSPLTKDYIIVGGWGDIPITSPLLIDVRLEIVDIRNRLAETSFILQHPSENFNKAQALDELVPGILYQTDGVVSIAILPYRKIWLGNGDNVATPVDRIWDDGVGHGNLPSYTPLEWKKIWVMDKTGTPVLSDELAKAESDILSLISNVTDILSSIASILDSISSLIDNIASILSRLTGIDTTLTDLQTQIDFIEEEIGIIDESLTTIEGDITTLQGLIDDLTARVVALETQMEIVNDAIATLEGDVAAIDIELETLTTEVATLTTDLAALTTEVEGIATDLAALDLTVSGLVTDVATLDATVAGLVTDVALLDTTVAGLVTDVAALDLTVAGLVTDVAALDADVAALDLEIESINGALLIITADISAIDLEILALQAWQALETEYMATAQEQITVLFGEVSAIEGADIALSGNVTGSQSMSNLILGIPITTTLNMTLDTIPAPVANVSLNSYKITNLDTPTTGTDAATKAYVDSVITGGTIVLTGDVTGSGVVGTPFSTTLALTLDQIPLAAANVNINTHKLTNVVDPTNPQDAATKAYVDSSVSSGTIDFTGAVIGSGVVGTPFTTTLDSIVYPTTGSQAFSYPIASSAAAFELISTFPATSLTNSNMELSLQNSIGAGYYFLLTSTYSGGTHPNGLFQFYSHDGGGDTYIYNATSSLFTFVIPVSMLSALDMGATQINNLAMAGSPVSTDAVNVAYLNSQIAAGTIVLTGAVTGSGTVGTPFATTLASTVNMTSGGEIFSFGNTVSAASFTLLGTYVPTLGTPGNVELTLQNQVGSGFDMLLTSGVAGGTFPDGIFEFYAFTSSTSTLIYKATSALVTFEIPVTFTTNISMAANQINNLAMAGSPASTDAVNVAYLNSRIAAGTIVLTGNVTGSGTVGTSFATTLNMTLDTIPLAAANVNINTHKLTNVVDPTSAQDAATKHYVDSSISAGTIVLTGAVTGSGTVGTPFATTMASTVNMTSGIETFSFGNTISAASFTLLGTYVPTLGTPGNVELTLQNQVGSGFELLLTSGVSGGTFPDGIFEFYAFTSSTSTLIYKATSSLVTFEIPVTFTTNISVASNQINNLAMAGSPLGTDAVNVSYLNSQIAAGTIVLTGSVTGSGVVGTSFATQLASTISPTGATQTFSFPSSQVSTNFKLKTNYTPTTGVASLLDLSFENSISSGYEFVLASSTSGGGYPNGQFQLYAYTASTNPLIFFTTASLFSFSIPVSIGGALSMGTNLINNVVDPVSAQDAATKNYVDTRTITLTGNVTGSGSVGGSFSTTLNMTLDTIPLAAANVNLNSKKITSLATPTLSGDATTKGYVDALPSVSGAFSIGGALNMTTHQINNLAMSGTPAGTDAVNVTYMNSAISTAVTAGTVVLTGNVTGSGVVGTSFATTLNMTLNTIPVAVASVSLNSQKIINLATPTLSTDAVNKSYVDALPSVSGAFSIAGALNMNTHQINNVAMAGTPATTDAVNVSYLNTKIAAGTVVLTGNVTGSGTVGASFATTLNMTLNTIPAPVASVSLNSQKITSLASPTTGTDAANRAFVETGASQYGGLYSSGGLSVSLTAGVWAKVTALDTFGSLSSFTAPPVSYRLVYSGPTTRVFYVNANISFTCPVSTNGMFFAIYLNGTIISPSQFNIITSTSSSITNNVSICTYVSLASTNYVEVWAYSNNTATITVQSAQLAVYAI